MNKALWLICAASNKGHFIQLGNAIPAFPDETDMPVLFYLPIPGSLTAAFLKKPSPFLKSWLYSALRSPRVHRDTSGLA
jgi:hypothetical protein